MGLVELGLERLCARGTELIARSEAKTLQLKELGAPSDLSRSFETAHCRLERVLGTLLPQTASSVRMKVPVESPYAGVDLYHFALENAVDGCFGELLLLRNEVESFCFALDENQNHTFIELVRCATLHAEVCWEVHAWCLGQLSPQRGRNIRASQHEALHFLQQGGLAPGLLSGLGLVEHRIDGKTVAA